MHLGEVNHLRKNVDRGSCQTCGSLDRCSLLGGIAATQIQEVYEILFSRVGSDITLLIDNSKRVPWVERFVGDRRYVRRFVHLIRDPRALVRRWSLYYPHWPGQVKQRWQAMRSFPQRVPALATAPQTAVYLYRWLAENQRITEFVRRHARDTLLCTYEELATAQSEQVRRIMEWIGLDYQPEQLEYWRRDHHGTQKQDYEWIKQKRAHYFDLRWKSFLTQTETQAIAHNADLQRYLTTLGLAMTDEGLVRLDSQGTIPAGSLR
jgi:hypothetical protein